MIVAIDFYQRTKDNQEASQSLCRTYFNHIFRFLFEGSFCLPNPWPKNTIFNEFNILFWGVFCQTRVVSSHQINYKCKLQVSNLSGMHILVGICLGHSASSVRVTGLNNIGKCFTQQHCKYNRFSQESNEGIPLWTKSYLLYVCVLRSHLDS